MIVDLPCGHRVDDEVSDTVCRPPGDPGASSGDRDRGGHWPLFASPATLCLHCDLYRPCGCDRVPA